MRLSQTVCSFVFSVILIACQDALSQAALVDVNSDGVDDEIHSVFGVNLSNPTTGLVTVYNGADSAILYQLTTGVPNDAFGFVVEVLPDIDADGTPELVVTAPRAGIGKGTLGRAYVYSGADGTLLYSVGGANGDRFGMAVQTPLMYLDDGTPLLVVAGMALDLQGIPVDRTHWFDATTGEVLSRRSEPIDGLLPVITPEGLVWGDIDQDADADSADVVVLMNEVNSGGEPVGGDLDGNQEVDAVDVGVLATAIGGGGSGGGPIGPATDPIAVDDWQALTNAMSLWAFLYPEDHISHSIGEPAVTEGMIPDWWFEQGFRARNGILGSGWRSTGGPGGCAVEPVLDDHGQRARQFSIDSADPDCGCEADVSISSFPEYILFDVPFDVCAEKEGDCGALEWKIESPSYSTGWVSGGDCASYVVPPLGPDIDPGDRHAVVSVRCTDCDDVSDSVTIPIVYCAVFIQDIAGSGFIDGGASITLEAIGVPTGGTYLWEILDNVHMVTSFVPNGATADVTVASTDPLYTTAVVMVPFKVTYTIGSCTAYSYAFLSIVLDSDGDGIPDRDENGGGCGAQFSIDADGDTLTDVEEAALGTDPCNTDSDGDTAEDGCEVSHGMDPTDPSDFLDKKNMDSDHDGLNDYEERSICGGIGTESGDWDTDNDGISDGCEVDNGTDPLDSSDPIAAGADPLIYDPDQDGAPTIQELCSGTDPNDPDTDDDGILDGRELQYMTCTSPFDPDSDGDGLLDGDEVDIYLTDPCDPDSDDDGLMDSFEILNVPSATNGNGAAAILLDPNNEDTDGDTILDGDEDLDGDNIPNGLEQSWSTNPFDTDSDGDGQSDDEEINGGSDPTDPTLLVSDHEDEWMAKVRFRIHSVGGDGSWSMYVSGRQFPVATAAYDSDDASTEYVEIPLRRGKKYDVRLKYGGSKSFASTCEHDFSYCASISSGDPAKWPLIIEDEQDDDLPLLTCYADRVCYDSYVCNPASGKTASFYLPIVDLDVDSDNDNVTGAPSRNIKEGAIEEEIGRAGRVVFTDLSDWDNDGIPSFADGFGLIPGDNDSAGLLTDRSFTPVVLELAGFVPADEYFEEQSAEYYLRFHYNASDPAQVTVYDAETDQYTLPETGTCRLWTKNVGDIRNLEDISQSDTATYIPNDVAIPFTHLGLSPSGGEITVWLESLSYSDSVGDRSIEVTVETQAASDKARLTFPSIDVAVWDDESQDFLPMQGLIPVSDARPEIEITVNGQPSIDYATNSILLDVGIAIEDPLSNVVTPSDRVSSVSLYANGIYLETFPIDPYQACSNSGGSGIYEWCHFRWELGSTQLQIPALHVTGNLNQIGVGTLVLEARTSSNAAGRIGYDKLGITTDVSIAQAGTIGSYMIHAGDPDDPQDEDVWALPHITAVTDLPHSPHGFVYPLQYQVTPLDRTTAESLVVEAFKQSSVGTAVLDLESEQYNLDALLYDQDPNRHYTVLPVDGRPQLFVLIGDRGSNYAIPDSDSIIVSTSSSGNTISYRTIDDNGSTFDRSTFTIVPVEDDPLPLGILEAYALDDVLLPAELLAAFQVKYSVEYMAMLGAFQSAEGDIRLRDISVPSRTVKDWDDGLTESIFIEINSDLDDLNPFQAADELAMQLERVLGESVLMENALQNYAVIDDLETWKIARAAERELALEAAAAGLDVYLTILEFTNTPTEIILTIDDLSDGNYWAVAGLVPVIPDVIRLGKKVTIKSKNVATGAVTQLFRTLDPHELKIIDDALEQAKSGAVTQNDLLAELVPKLGPEQTTYAIQTGRLSPVIKPSYFKSTGTNHRSNIKARHNWTLWPRRLGQDNVEVHHGIPMQSVIRVWAGSKGIDVNEGRWLRAMKRSDHRGTGGLHTGVKFVSPLDGREVTYNKWWLDLITAEKDSIISPIDDAVIAGYLNSFVNNPELFIASNHRILEPESGVWLLVRNAQ